MDRTSRARRHVPTNTSSGDVASFAFTASDRRRQPATGIDDPVRDSRHGRAPDCPGAGRLHSANDADGGRAMEVLGVETFSSLRFRQQLSEGPRDRLYEYEIFPAFAGVTGFTPPTSSLAYQRPPHPASARCALA